MKQYKARDKITQKMSRDGAIEVNAATGKQKRISKRAREAALLKTPEQQAAHTVKQRFKLSALRGLTCDLIREKELIYRNVKKGAKLIQHLQTWVLPLIFYGNKVTGS